MKNIVFSLILLLFFSFSLHAQFADEYKSGFNINIDEDGSKYLKVISYGHFWWQDNEGHHPADGVSIRRMGILMIGQINDRFKIVNHIGLGNATASNLTITKDGGGPLVEIIGFFGEFKVWDELSVGIGKHYYNGINRMNSASALNILAIDANRSSWPTAGLSDEGLRHLGIFAKGDIDRFHYRLSINSPAVNTSDGNSQTSLEIGEEKYLGRALLDQGKYAYAGYFDYQFLDKEPSGLPYSTGTYLGTKKVLTLGTGFFYHRDGIAAQTENTLVGKDVAHLAVDLFYDSPLGENGAALTAYGIFQHSKMGDHYLNGRINGNGPQLFLQTGYLIPKKTETHRFRNRWQAFASYSYRDFKGLPKAAEDLQIGFNYYVDGQNAKISAQYQNSLDLPKGNQHQILIQAMFAL